MYKLVCGDKNNSKILYNSAKNSKSFDEIRRKATIERITEFIFNETLSERQVGDLVAALSLGDELINPISEQNADILFFSLCSNYFIKDKTKRIKWYSEAKKLFNKYNNNYIDYANMEIENIEYIDINWNNNLALESYIKFKIPITHFMFEGNKYCTISSKGPFKLKLNSEEEFTIPRGEIMELFTKKYGGDRVVGQDEDQIKDAFDSTNIPAISQILINLGFKKLMNLEDDGLNTFKKLYSYQNGKLLFRYVDVEDYLEAKKDNLNPLKIYWKEINNNCFILCPKYPYILWGDLEDNNCIVLIKK